MTACVELDAKRPLRRVRRDEPAEPIPDWSPDLDAYLDQLQAEYARVLRKVTALEIVFREPAPTCH